MPPRTPRSASRFCGGRGNSLMREPQLKTIKGSGPAMRATSGGVLAQLLGAEQRVVGRALDRRRRRGRWSGGSVGRLVLPFAALEPAFRVNDELPALLRPLVGLALPVERREHQAQ